MKTTLEIAARLWGTLGEMAPYLLFGFAVAGALSVWISAEWVGRHLGERRRWAVVKAALFGVPLPLCSCGVLPVAASLSARGAGRGAVTAFLLSTPQTGVDSVLVTYSLLGPVFAVFRPVAAFLTGVVGGWLADVARGAGRPPPARAECDGACCAKGSARPPWYRRAFRHGFVTLPRDVAPSMTVGLLLAGVIGVLVPDDFLAGALGTGFLAMLAMMALGIPLYVCATASVPIAAALIAKGVTPGAALVFLMTGPATNAATLATLCRVLGIRTAAIYLATVAGSALLCGVLLDALFRLTVASPPALCHAGHLSAFEHISGVVLAVVLAAALWGRRRAA